MPLEPRKALLKAEVIRRPVNGRIGSLPLRELPRLASPRATGQARTVIVGTGSSAAYYLNALQGGAESDASATLASTVLFGKNDAWSPFVRGRGFVNHQAELIAQWSGEVPAHDERFDSRTRIISDNESQIARAVDAGAKLVNQNVVRIERTADGPCIVTGEDHASIAASEVVLAAGLGPHTSLFGPRETAAQLELANVRLIDRDKLVHKVFNVDQFMRAVDADAERFKGRTVVIHGANAGWDAVERAGELQLDVKWMIRHTAPAFFDGTQLKHAPRIATQGLIRASRLEVRPGVDGGVHLRYEPLQSASGGRAASVELKADFYVYAFGQDVDAPGGARRLLGRETRKLRPVYDLDQIYTDQPWETVLAFRTGDWRPGKGIQVIGAAVSALAPFVPHTYVEDESSRLKETVTAAGVSAAVADSLARAIAKSISPQAAEAVIGMFLARLGERSLAACAGPVRKHAQNIHRAGRYLRGRTNVSAEVANQVRTATASVVVQAQFGAIRGSIAAVLSHIPGYIQHGKANFSTDDRTMLMVLIAQAYSHVEPRFAERFIEATIRIRQMSEAELRTEIVRRLLDSRDAQATQRPLTDDASRQTLARSLALEGIPSRGVPERVRMRYERVLENMLPSADGDPAGSLMSAWLKP